MLMSSISVCMITKNDGDTIRNSLGSIRSIAHELVIVDAGSKDNTLEEVKKFEAQNNVPCKIIHHVWDNNFSKVRNIALKNATCTWIFMLEPHETVKRADLNTIKSLVLDDQYLGYYMHRAVRADDPCHDILEHISKQSIKTKQHTFIPELRLFRNNDMIKYEGIIYESVEASLHKLGQSYKTSIRLG